MVITADSPFHAPPRISRERFARVMQDVGSPWAGKAGALYDLIAGEGDDPAVWLAIGLREHRLLTDPIAVALRLMTHSWTNARSVRLPNLDYEVVSTDDLRKAGLLSRNGPYIRYRSVEDSLRDGIWRVRDPGYAYQLRYGPGITIGQVLSLWTEADAATYTAFVVAKLNEWSEPVSGQQRYTEGDDPAFAWLPELAGEFGYPQGTFGRNGYPIDLLIMHITIGHDSLDWLRGQHENSAHYLTHRDGRPRAQMVREQDAAWAAGNREYNLRGIQIEHEKRDVRDPWTDGEYRNLAQIAARIIRRNPAILPDRQHVIGHNEVPDPFEPGRFGGAGNHVDPGPGFDWTRFMDYVHQALQPQSDALVIDGVPLVLGFRDHFLEVGKAVCPEDPVLGGIAVFGKPLEPEYRTAFGAAQRFEGYVMEWHRDNAPPFDIIRTLRGQPDPERAE